MEGITKGYEPVHENKILILHTLVAAFHELLIHKGDERVNSGKRPNFNRHFARRAFCA